MLKKIKELFAGPVITAPPMPKCKPPRDEKRKVSVCRECMRVQSDAEKDDMFVWIDKDNCGFCCTAAQGQSGGRRP